MRYLCFAFSIFLLFNACQNKTTSTGKLDIHWELKQNLMNDQGQALWALTVTNNLNFNLPKQGWCLYFNSIQNLKADSTSGVEILHVNGDLRVIKPNSEFSGIKKGKSKEFPIYSGSSALNFTDAPIGFYLVLDSDESKGIPCNLTLGEFPKTGLNRTTWEQMPVYDAEVAYTENLSLSILKKGEFCPIVPTPKQIQLFDNNLELSNEISVAFDSSFTNEALFLKQKLNTLFAGQISLNQAKHSQIVLAKSKDLKMKPEAYSLNISESGIRIEAATPTGIFYGIQSLIGLVPIENWQSEKDSLVLSYASIIDEPRFEYRGMFMDVARNFQPKENVLRLLDVMAFYKLNKFHFHLCDDEGWRLEIDGLPELTDFGGFRGYSENESKYLYPSFGSGPDSSTTFSHGSGFYTRQDFIDILKYATERHIEVIPEIDMPGHARAAIRSMQVRYQKYIKLNESEKANEYLLNDWEDESQYRSVQGWNDNVVNVGMESTYKFLEKVTREIVLLFNEADAPLKCIHTGGDEVPKGVWEKSPACQKFIESNDELNNRSELPEYFVIRFSNILAQHGLVAAGWEEIALIHGSEIKPNPKLVGKNLRPYVWNNMWNSGAEDIGYKLANAGYPVVLAHVTNLYFDLAYNKNPLESGYYWGSFVDTRKPWEYTPFDILKCADKDHFGVKINKEELAQNIEHLTDKGKANVLGMQGLLWSENNLGLERMEYMVLPKLLGLAERAWANEPEWAKIEDDDLRIKEKEQAWNKFVNTLGQLDLPRLDYFNDGMGYRIPVPGAIMKDGLLYANIRFPGLQIKYTLDGSEPNINSTLYEQPIQVNGIVKLKAFTKNGKSGRIVKLN
jgi:hexosaminidase